MMNNLESLFHPQGMVYVLHNSNCNALLNMADQRFNMVPIIHNHIPSQYRMLINTVDVLFATVDHPADAREANLNAKYFLKTGGHYMLYVKASCIESTTDRGTDQGLNRGDAVFSSVGKTEQVQFKRLEQVTLEPFDRDHAYVSGVFRTLEKAEIDPSCLATSKFWTSLDLHRGDGKYVCLYEQHKNLPVFMLFDSAYGYLLFRAHDVYKVERHFLATEEYIKRFDEFFELIACHTFESTDDAMMYHDAAYNDTYTEKLMEFLVLNLPPAMEGDKHCYSLALPCMESEIVYKLKIACSNSLFHEEIIRGVRINIDKFFKNMKPGDLENAQLDLARKYCRHRLISPDKGKSQKKRCGFRASVPTRKNPKRKGRADAKTN